MEKKILLFILLFGSVMVAQVGINTDDPQQEVHVSGTTENVRVEGLNKLNNIENLGSESNTRVFVNADGDLVLGSVNEQPMKLLVDSDNYIKDGNNTGPLSGGANQINQTGTGGAYTQAGLPDNLSASFFTLTQSAIVEVNYSVSWLMQKNNNGRIEDRHARIVQTALYFRKVPDNETPPYGNPYSYPAVIYDIDNVAINGGPWCIGVSGSGFCNEEGGLIALNGQFYTNGNKSNGAFENLRNTGTDYVKLPAGTYVALFVAQVAVSLAAGTGSIKAHLGTGKDELQIIAHYYY